MGVQQYTIVIYIRISSEDTITTTLFMSKKVEERGKTTWGKSSLKKGQGTKFELCMYLHLNELDELLLVKDLLKKFVYFMMMH